MHPKLDRGVVNSIVVLCVEALHVQAKAKPGDQFERIERHVVDPYFYAFPCRDYWETKLRREREDLPSWERWRAVHDRLNEFKKRAIALGRDNQLTVDVVRAEQEVQTRINGVQAREACVIGWVVNGQRR